MKLLKDSQSYIFNGKVATGVHAPLAACKQQNFFEAQGGTWKSLPLTTHKTAVTSNRTSLLGQSPLQCSRIKLRAPSEKGIVGQFLLCS